MHRAVFAILASTLLAACQDGTLVLDIADAPVDQATSVVLEISEIDLLKSDGDDKKFSFSPPQQVDLLQFTGGLSSTLLNGERVPEGDYTGLRLIVDVDDASQSFIDFSNSVPQRLVLSDGTDEITINEPFTIERRKELAITLDVDLRQSVLAPTNSTDPYELDPITRLIKTEDAATISGTVASNLVPNGCSPAVYVYEGHDVEPDDMDAASDVFASGRVSSGNINGFSYGIGFLPAGDYTVAFTCDAIDDDPRDNDDIVFGPPVNVTVEAGQTATVNF